MECTASENSDAEPVKNQPIVLTTAFVALLNERDNRVLFTSMSEFSHEHSGNDDFPTTRGKNIFRHLETPK